MSTRHTFDFSVTPILAHLRAAQQLPLLAGGLRGIERECLRVNPDASLNTEPHPAALGATLTHEHITTDYSESLMEFITSALPDAPAAVAQLTDIHRYTYTHLGAQSLWSASMLCVLPPEAQIPIAWYGNSHIGMLKHVYRRGLALRYGKAMQCIAGLHYNLSFAPELWPALRALDPDASRSALNPQDYQSERYVDVIRNFLRINWLLMYLFGASPALEAHFLRDKPHDLAQLSEDTLYRPYATSLRMSDLGYQNNAQDGLVPPYNTLLEYMQSLSQAVRKPYAPYAAIGCQQGQEWVQINTNVLQIENEFYASIRPKQVIRTGERPIQALCARGVQYIEVRCMDIDPFAPVGIAVETTRFLDIFMLYCALAASPKTSVAEGAINQSNFAATVNQGRDPALMLNRNGQYVGLRTWADELLDAMQPIAAQLDELHHTDEYSRSFQAQRDKVANDSLTPSAQVLAQIRAHGNSFSQFALHQSLQHAATLRATPLDEATRADLDAQGRASLVAQAELERNQQGSFDEFIQHYREQTGAHLCTQSTQ